MSGPLRLLLCLTLLAAALPLATAGAADGLASLTKELDTPLCSDGIGHTFLNPNTDGNTSGVTPAFLRDYAACGPLGIVSPMLLGECTDAVRLPEVSAADVWVVCHVMVANTGNKYSLTLDIDDFLLVSDTGIESPDPVVSRTADARYDLTGGPRTIAPGGVASGVLAFAVPAGNAGQDLVLDWKNDQLKLDDPSDQGARAIILGVREPMLAALLSVGKNATSVPATTNAKATQPPPSPDAPRSFSGTSDDVTQPITLTAGLHVVDASFRGDGNFAVIAHWGSGQDLLVNTIGGYSGRVALTLDAPASVVFEVKANGPWQIQVAP